MRNLTLAVLLFLLIKVVSTTDRNREKRDYRREREADYDTSDEDDDSESDFPFTDFDFNSLTGDVEPAKQGNGFFSRVWGSAFNDLGNEQQSKSETGSLFGFISEMRPWWNGPNVCMREEEKVENRTTAQVNFGENAEVDNQERSRIRGIINGVSTSCADFGYVYKCTVITMRNGNTTTKTRTYECCYGYARSDDGKGCTKEVELSDLKSTLEKLNLTRFLEAADRIGLDNLITEGNNYTYFVPNNAAWDALTDSEQFNIIVTKTNDKNGLTRDILMAHIVPGWQYSYDWFDEMTINTSESNSPVRINFFSTPRPFSTANCARITSTNHKATNGIIHQIDSVMMPPEGTLWDQLSKNQQFSKYLSLVDEKLQKRLMDPNEHLTVLAFTDEAFNRLPDPVHQAIINQNKCYKDLISEHILPHTICSAAVNGDAKIRNIADHYINASRTQVSNEQESILTFHDVSVTSADRLATNGVLHVLDGVIRLEYMLDTMEVLKRRGAVNFANMLTDNGLTVQDYPEVTLFVPPELSLQGLSGEDLKKTLETHIVADTIELHPRRGLGENESVVTMQSGNEVPLSLCGSLFHFPITASSSAINAHIGCSQIIAANVRTCNGVIHFIDKPLTFPKQTVLELLRSRADMSQFVSMLEASSLMDVVNKNDFGGTILAPANAAIDSAFTADDKQALFDDRNQLDMFIKRHITGDELCEYQLRNTVGPFALRRLQSLAGDPLYGRYVRGKLQVGGVPVSKSDLRATNGIVHVLDQPIPRRRQSALWEMLGFSA